MLYVNLVRDLPSGYMCDLGSIILLSFMYNSLPYRFVPIHQFYVQWRVLPSIMWCHVIWLKFTIVSEEYTAFIFGIVLATWLFSLLMGIEDQNVDKFLQDYMLSQTRRHYSSLALLWEPQSPHFCIMFRLQILPNVPGPYFFLFPYFFPLKYCICWHFRRIFGIKKYPISCRRSAMF
jgi:hypothetical protein